MTSPSDPATSRWLIGQGRILEVLADGDALSGTLDCLGRQFELPPDDLRACLRELVRAGWVVIRTQPFGRLTIRLERRAHTAPPPVTGERRGSVPDAWEL